MTAQAKYLRAWRKAHPDYHKRYMRGWRGEGRYLQHYQGSGRRWQEIVKKYLGKVGT